MEKLFARHWGAFGSVLLSALYTYLQLLQWKKHGDDFMLIAANIVVTAILWIVLLISISRYWRLSEREERKTRTASNYADEDFPVVTKEAIRDDAMGRGHPSKVYCQLLNKTRECVEVKVLRWVTGIQANVFQDVLQLSMDKKWVPTPDGVASVCVPPGGRFRLWIAPDQQYGKEELQRRCDEKRLGTLALLVNGQELDIIL